MKKITPAGVFETPVKKKYTVEIIESSEEPQNKDAVWIDAIDGSIATYEDGEWLNSIRKDGLGKVEYVQNSGYEITEIDVNNFVRNYKPSNGKSLFSGIFRLKNLKSLDTSKFTDMSYMFYGVRDGLDVSNIDISNVTNISGMFNSAKATTLDLSNWDTSNITHAKGVFSQLNVDILDLSNWKLNNVTSLDNFLGHAMSIRQLKADNLDTSNITRMDYAFQYFPGEMLDLSSWDVSNVTTMNNMFDESKIKTIKVSGWGDKGNPNFFGIFNRASNLLNIIGPWKNIKTTFTASDCPLTRESALVLIEGLAAPKDSGILTLSSTTKKTLTEEDIAKVTSKGWTLA